MKKNLHEIIMNNTVWNLLKRKDKKEIISFCREKYPLVKLRLRNNKSNTDKIGWGIHQRYVKAGADPNLFKCLSLKFSGDKWIIGEQLNKDFPGEGSDVLKKFLTSSLTLGGTGMSDLNLYIGQEIVSDTFILEFYKSQQVLNNNK